MASREGIGDVLDEDQAQHQVLVLRCIHVGPELIGCGPEGFLDIFDHHNSVISIGSRDYVSQALLTPEQGVGSGYGAGAFMKFEL